jgi:hypothetical protein
VDEPKDLELAVAQGPRLRQGGGGDLGVEAATAGGTSRRIPASRSPGAVVRTKPGTPLARARRRTPAARVASPARTARCGGRGCTPRPRRHRASASRGPARRGRARARRPERRPARRPRLHDNGHVRLQPQQRKRARRAAGPRRRRAEADDRGGPNRSARTFGRGTRPASTQPPTAASVAAI